MVSGSRKSTDMPLVDLYQIIIPRLKELSAILFGALMFAGQASAAEKLKMISDWAFQAQAAVFTNAIDKGYFAEQGLEVAIDRGYGSADAITKNSPSEAMPNMQRPSISRSSPSATRS